MKHLELGQDNILNSKTSQHVQRFFIDTKNSVSRVCLFWVVQAGSDLHPETHISSFGSEIFL